MPQSVFAKYTPRAFPHRFRGELYVYHLVGGIPSDERTAVGWIKTKLALKDDLLRQAVAEVMAERGLDAEQAAQHVAEQQTLNGFKRDGERGLYIEGRQLKACLKEAVCVAANEGKLRVADWGNATHKSLHKWVTNWFPEHVFVVEDRLYIANGTDPVHRPTDIQRRFVHTYRGSAIQHEEYIEGARVAFTVETDHRFADEEWAMIWLTAERQGIGASRSQGFGRFTTTTWEEIVE